MLNTNKRSHVNKLYQRLSQKTHVRSEKKRRGKLCMSVCVWVGRLLWKCISCITFLFLIFHALWIYLNPLRWIEKEKKGKAEVRDMQNKKHPPLANVLPLSSFAFLILSSLFFYFFTVTGGHFSEVICRHWTQNHGHTVLEREEQRRGRDGDRAMCVCVCVCVCDCDYERSLRWWMDSRACFKPAVAERQRGEEGAEREDGCWGRKEGCCGWAIDGTDWCFAVLLSISCVHGHRGPLRTISLKDQNTA